MSGIAENKVLEREDPAEKNGKGVSDSESYKMRRRKNKKIWTYYDRISPHLVSCKACKALLSCKHTSANLVRHMYLRHKVDSSLQGAEKTGFLNLHGKSRVKKKEAIESIASTHNQINEDPLAEIKKYEEGLLDMGNEHGKVEKSEISIEMLEEFDQDAMNDECAMIDSHSLNEFQLELTEPESTNMFTKDNEQKSSNINLNQSHFEVEKLRAETRYFHEMAALARAKRTMIELQTQKIRRELGVFDAKF